MIFRSCFGRRPEPTEMLHGTETDRVRGLSLAVGRIKTHFYGPNDREFHVCQLFHGRLHRLSNVYLLASLLFFKSSPHACQYVVMNCWWVPSILPVTRDNRTWWLYTPKHVNASILLSNDLHVKRYFRTVSVFTAFFLGTVYAGETRFKAVI